MQERIHSSHEFGHSFECTLHLILSPDCKAVLQQFTAIPLSNGDRWQTDILFRITSLCVRRKIYKPSEWHSSPFVNMQGPWASSASLKQSLCKGTVDWGNFWSRADAFNFAGYQASQLPNGWKIMWLNRGVIAAHHLVWRRKRNKEVFFVQLIQICQKYGTLNSAAC